MKTYRIKPIEWEESHGFYRSPDYDVALDLESCTLYNAYNNRTWGRIHQGTLDECKAACQAHLESKILPYLEEL